MRCPTLVIVGDEDIADMQGIAATSRASIGGARLATGGRGVAPAEPRAPGEVNPILGSRVPRRRR